MTSNDKPIRIFLVEDSDTDAELFKRALQKDQLTAEITHYLNPEDSLNRLVEDTTSFDIVVTDYNMPEMDGLELCQKLLDKKILLPLILFTGTGSENLAVEALKAGVDDYIIKDVEGGYLKLLPIVIPDVIKKFQDRVARKKAEKEIRDLLREKELLLKEIHHRVRNNMSTIIGLLLLQIETLDNPDATKALEEAGTRVQSMLVLYDKLYVSSDYENVPIKNYLETLLEEIKNNFPNKGIVEIETQIEDFILGAKTVFNLGIIINELITNTMKYAFVGKKAGQIFVSTSTEDNHVTLVFQDNGVEVPESINFEESTGFGFGLIKMLIEQLKGSILLIRDRGTKFIINFDIDA